MIFIEKGAAPVTAEQLNKRTQAYIDRDWPEWKRERSIRNDDGEFNTYMAQVALDTDTNRANNLFNSQLKAYKQAVARLDKYVLADGREEVKEWQVSDVKTDYVMYEGEAIAVDSYGTSTGTGTALTGYDEVTEEPIYTTVEYTYDTITFGDVTLPVGEVEYAVEVIVQTAVEPLEPTVERIVYSDDFEAEPTVETIENPLITADNLERAAAQAVVDATPQLVKDAAEVVTADDTTSPEV